MPPAAVCATSSALGLTVLWLLGLGGIVGSFLNVVIYRTPRGQSVVRPGSRCPRCGEPIRWYDNVPVVSWLLLAGRCRDCRGPISPRYPAVEAVCALVFLGLGLMELGPDGFLRVLRALASLGSATGPADLEPPAAAAFAPVLPACLRLACHLTLFCTLLGHLLIHWDGHRTTGLFFLPAILVGGLAGIWPGVRLPGPWPAVTGPLVGLAGGITGLLVGVSCDWLWRRCEPWLRATGGARPGPGSATPGDGVGDTEPYTPEGRPRLALSALAAIGCVLGWQAAALMFAVGLAGGMVIRPFLPRLRPQLPLVEAIWLLGSLCWSFFWVA